MNKRTDGIWAVWVVASVLWLAAVLKLVALWRTPNHDMPLLHGLAILAEVWIAAWLTLAQRRHFAVIAATALIAAFILYNVYLLMAGESDCRCLGVVKTSPWMMLQVDLILLVGIGLIAKHPSGRSPNQTSRWIVGGLCAGMTVALGVALFARPQPVVPNSAMDIQPGSIVIIDPVQWSEGQVIPILRYLVAERDLMQGEWHVLLVREDCPACQDRIRRMAKKVDEQAFPVALVGMDGPAPLSYLTLLEQGGIPAIPAQLDVSIRWMASTPVEWRMRHGRLLGEGQALKILPQTSNVSAHLEGTHSDQATVAATPSEIDWGYVEPGSRHEASFQVINPTSTDIRIRAIVPECVCTRIVDHPQAIPAHSSVTIHVDFTALNVRTPYRQKIQILLDGPAKSLEIATRARIGLPLAVKPEQIELKPGQRSGSLSLRNDAGQPVRILYADTNYPGLIVRVSPQMLASGASVDLPWQVTSSPITDLRQMHYGATVYTDSPFQPELYVPVSIKKSE